MESGAMITARKQGAASESGLLVESLLAVFNEIRDERHVAAASGPQLSDTIRAQMLAKVLRNLADAPESRAQHLAAYLQSNTEVAEWAETLLATTEGRMNLKALLRIELQKPG
jgi:hypothetical protein